MVSTKPYNRSIKYHIDVIISSLCYDVTLTAATAALATASSTSAAVTSE